jgi:Cytochrome c554 and c-prime
MMQRSLNFASVFAARFVALTALIVLTAAAQGEIAPLLPHQSPHKTMGAATCASSLCHGSVSVWTGSNVLQTEYTTWSRMDKHARAYNLLFNDTSKRIAKNLGLEAPAHQADVCLDCHAHNVPSARHGEKFTVAENITCESCHGPAEKWIRSHVAGDASHVDNIANGLYPTEDPVARAKLCLGCHFGNRDKVITHRIMGAGHPRIHFELDRYTEMAPKHFVIDADYAKRKRVWEGVKVWAIGQAITVVETIDWLNDDKRNRDGVFPELVLFDCHACHRPMAERRFQATTALGAVATPGLVRLNDGGLLMVRAIARSLDASLGERVRTESIALHRAVAGSGNVLAASNALKASCNEVISRLKTTNINAEWLARVLNQLIDDGIAGTYRDVAAAEQASLAMASLGDWLAKQGRLKSASAFQSQWKKLNTVVLQDEKFVPNEFVARLRELKQTVQVSSTTQARGGK